MANRTIYAIDCGVWISKYLFLAIVALIAILVCFRSVRKNNRKINSIRQKKHLQVQWDTILCFAIFFSSLANFYQNTKLLIKQKTWFVKRILLNKYTLYKYRIYKFESLNCCYKTTYFITNFSTASKNKTLPDSFKNIA